MSIMLPPQHIPVQSDRQQQRFRSISQVAQSSLFTEEGKYVGCHASILVLEQKFTDTVERLTTHFLCLIFVVIVTELQQRHNCAEDHLALIHSVSPTEVSNYSHCRVQLPGWSPFSSVYLKVGRSCEDHERKAVGKSLICTNLGIGTECNVAKFETAVETYFSKQLCVWNIDRAQNVAMSERTTSHQFNAREIGLYHAIATHHRAHYQLGDIRSSQLPQVHAILQSFTTNLGAFSVIHHKMNHGRWNILLFLLPVPIVHIESQPLPSLVLLHEITDDKIDLS
mmetsp:Transcript_18133/g.37754  ORF Transcript_18133/g.37754 Transcript_18133/m.37754 type:complete len:282 (+) Transcript_18133:136-981(+)